MASTFQDYSPDMEFTSFDHPVFDCDFHFYETAESFTRYLPKELNGVIRTVQVDGRTKVAVKGRISEYIPNPTFEVVAAPASGLPYFMDRNTEGKAFRDIITPMRAIPEFTDRESRMRLIDRMHIDAILNFPTLASVVEVNFMDDPITTQKLIHAFNMWMFDDWGFNIDNRIFSTPVMNLSTLEGAVSELEWALERGARTVLVRPAPVAGFRGSKSPFLPEFDPFWARVQEAGIPVMFHTSDSGYQRYANDWLGRGDQEFLAFVPEVFSLMATHYRAVMDTIFSAVGHGMLSRFPKIPVATIECGSKWIHRLKEDFLSGYGKMPQLFAEHPFDVLDRQLYIAPYAEEPLQPLIDSIGIDRVLFNSDWPHPEGLADPVEYVKVCREIGLSDTDTAKIMGGNMFKLMGF
ncbi:MAG: amidohydrolase family protein [Acidimicrobiia bacterium]